MHGSIYIETREFAQPAEHMCISLWIMWIMWIRIFRKLVSALRQRCY